MKTIFTKRQAILPVCLALATSTLAAGCASNGNKKTETVEIKQPVPVVSQVQANNNQAVDSKDSGSIIAVEEVKPVAETSVTTESTSEHMQKANLEYPYIDIKDDTQPEQMTFQFGFDKSDLSEEDKEIVKQHARFLLENPGMIIKIQGHTDSQGPHTYNQHLSKKRAEAVANIMLAEGVPESQLEIVALADDAPLADAEDTRKNRRVELEYNEVNLVKKD
jgi:peptidoglycan-associated lipoprotein